MIHYASEACSDALLGLYPGLIAILAIAIWKLIMICIWNFNTRECVSDAENRPAV
jgi:hypothetical protein